MPSKTNKALAKPAVRDRPLDPLEVGMSTDTDAVTNVFDLPPVTSAVPLDEVILAHSGYVAVIGRPNVGKSTLMNRLLGQKIAIVSPKPQTTRLRQLGIYSTDDTQAIFVDTPGIHEPRHKLGEFMVAVALEALRDADVILFVL